LRSRIGRIDRDRSSFGPRCEASGGTCRPPTQAMRPASYGSDRAHAGRDADTRLNCWRCRANAGFGPTETNHATLRASALDDVARDPAVRGGERPQSRPSDRRSVLGRAPARAISIGQSERSRPGLDRRRPPADGELGDPEVPCPSHRLFGGPDQFCLCGNAITIADYLGASLLGVGEAIGCDFSEYPNIRRWLRTMRRLKGWPRVFAPFDSLVGSLYERRFVRV
jgi:hypothetical protein